MSSLTGHAPHPSAGRRGAPRPGRVRLRGRGTQHADTWRFQAQAGQRTTVSLALGHPGSGAPWTAQRHLPGRGRLGQAQQWRVTRDPATHPIAPERVTPRAGKKRLGYAGGVCGVDTAPSASFLENGPWKPPRGPPGAEQAWTAPRAQAGEGGRQRTTEHVGRPPRRGTGALPAGWALGTGLGPAGHRHLPPCRV